MPTRDLCILSDVYTWLGTSSGSANAILSGLISQCSADILAELNRGSLLTTTYTEYRDGNGGDRIMLRNWPVLSMASLTIDGTSIPETTDPTSYGWMLETIDPDPPGRRQTVDLIGAKFNRGRRNVAAVYTAGYGIVDETQTVTSAAATVSAPYGAWINDNGVKYASDNTSLTLVSGTPNAGQYALNSGTPGGYTFNAADNGKDVLISYDYVPHVLRQSCVELVAERYRYRDRIGQKSQSLGGEQTVSYDNSGLTAFVAARLQSFKSVVPV